VIRSRRLAPATGRVPLKPWPCALGLAIIVHLGLCPVSAHAEGGRAPSTGSFDAALAVIGAPIHGALPPTVPCPGGVALVAVDGGRAGEACAHPPGNPPPASATEVLCLVCASRT
jgi:hypothetical protein